MRKKRTGKRAMQVCLMILEKRRKERKKSVNMISGSNFQANLKTLLSYPYPYRELVHLDSLRADMQSDQAPPLPPPHPGPLISTKLIAAFQQQGLSCLAGQRFTKSQGEHLKYQQCFAVQGVMRKRTRTTAVQGVMRKKTRKAVRSICLVTLKETTWRSSRKLDKVGSPICKVRCNNWG